VVDFTFRKQVMKPDCSKHSDCAREWEDDAIATYGS